MLKANRLHCERDERILFSDLTFDVCPGSFLKVTGPNGSGKSSLLKILAGLLPPSEGQVIWQGNNIQALNGLYASHLLYIGHKTGLQPALTPIENLTWLLALQAQNDNNSVSFGSESNSSGSDSGPNSAGSNRDRIVSALQTVGLKPYQNVPCIGLSAGQRQRVTLARCWIQNAKLWILDEPLIALDDAGQELLQNRLLDHLREGGLLVVASHHGLSKLKTIPHTHIALSIQPEALKC